MDTREPPHDFIKTNNTKTYNSLNPHNCIISENILHCHRPIARDSLRHKRAMGVEPNSSKTPTSRPLVYRELAFRLDKNKNGRPLFTERVRLACVKHIYSGSSMMGASLRLGHHL